MKERQWYANYETEEEASRVCQALNKLSEKGNIFCCRWLYSVGPANKISESVTDTWRGIYVEPK